MDKDKLASVANIAGLLMSRLISLEDLSVKKESDPLPFILVQNIAAAAEQIYDQVYWRCSEPQ